METYTECCRFCLSYKQDQLEPILTNPEREKILMFSSIDIEINERISTMICQQCLQKINDCSEFETTRNNNQATQEELVDEIQDIHNMSIEIIEVSDYETPMEDGNEETSNSNQEKVETINLDSSEEESTLQFSTASPIAGQDYDAELEEKKLCNNFKEIAHGIGSEGPTEVMESNIQKSSDENLVEKIEFAAALCLIQRNSTPITMQNLSSVEMSYIEKCKAMVAMCKSLICPCHNVSHPSLRVLLSHLRAFGTESPVYTCYHCMITFKDRWSSGKHNRKCYKKNLDTLVKLSNLKKRSAMKTRIYQNYKCVECQLIFSFHDDFCKHIDEQHIERKTPILCSCQKNFGSVIDYNDHMYLSCMVEYYCDICFTSVKTLRDFIDHAVKNHDNNEGLILLQDDNYERKPSVKVEPKENRRPSSTNCRTPPAIKPKAMDLAMKTNNDSNVLKISGNSTTKPPECGKDYSRPTCMQHQHQSIENKDKQQSNGSLMIHDYSCQYQEYQEEQQESHEISQGDLGVKDPCETEPTVEKYSCKPCNTFYTGYSGLRVHNEKKHLDKQTTIHTYPRQCDECEKVITRGSAFVSHKQMHRRMREKTARISNDPNFLNEIPSRTKARKSINKPATSNNFDCKSCRKSFASQRAVNSHQGWHQSIKTETLLKAPNLKKCQLREKAMMFICPICKVELPNETALKIHILEKHEHVDASTLRCKSCNLEFATLTDYENHKKAHETVENQKKIVTYSCKYCFASFTLKETFESHIRLDHAAVYDEIKCGHCGRVFDNLAALTNHVKIHGEHKAVIGSPKPLYLCYICHRDFHILKDLRTHITIAHPF